MLNGLVRAYHPALLQGALAALAAFHFPPPEHLEASTPLGEGYAVSALCLLGAEPTCFACWELGPPALPAGGLLC